MKMAAAGGARSSPLLGNNSIPAAGPAFSFQSCDRGLKLELTSGAGVVYRANDRWLARSGQGAAGDLDLPDDRLSTVLLFGIRNVAEIAADVESEIFALLIHLAID